MNMPLMEKGKSILSGVGLALTLVLVDKTPHEAWIGKKLSLKHHKLFSFDAYVHIPGKRGER